jgi:hypothetical protein
VDWRTKGPGDLWTPFRTFASGLARTDAAAYEWVGLLTYWLSGRIPEILPGPRAS